jgi:hypothetical protein
LSCWAYIVIKINERINIMWEDPIVEELHAVRAQLLARFGGDLHKYCDYVMSLPSPANSQQPLQPVLPLADGSSGGDVQPRLK